MRVFERTETTARLVNYLLPLKKGTQVDYAELTRIVGVTVTSTSPRLISARQILQREHNAVWVPVRPGIGLRRLNDVEIARRLPEWWMKGARNKLRRGDKQSAVVEINALDMAQQTRFAVACVQRELAARALSKASLAQLERAARGNGNQLPSFNAVEWMVSLTPRRPRES